MYPTALLLAWFPFLQEQAQVEKTLEHHTLVHVSSPPRPTSRSLVEPWRTVVRRGGLMGTSCEVVAHTAATAADKAAWLAVVAAAFTPPTRAFTLATVVVVVAIRAAAAAASVAVEDVTTAATTKDVEGEALVVTAAAAMAKPMAVTRALETSRSRMHLGDNLLFPTCMATGHKPQRYLLMLLLFFNKLLHLFTREHTRLQLRTTSTPWRKQPSQRRVTMLWTRANSQDV